ncbi:MAG: hypothetical protein WBO70_03930 [Erysipelotrichaceae bacterium]
MNKKTTLIVLGVIIGIGLGIHFMVKMLTSNFPLKYEDIYKLSIDNLNIVIRKEVVTKDVQIVVNDKINNSNSVKLSTIGKYLVVTNDDLYCNDDKVEYFKGTYLYLLDSNKQYYFVGDSKIYYKNKWYDKDISKEQVDKLFLGFNGTSRFELSDFDTMEFVFKERYYYPESDKHIENKLIVEYKVNQQDVYLKTYSSRGDNNYWILTREQFSKFCANIEKIISE